MDCPKAETAMMHYIEGTLPPEDATALTRHVLECTPCRELYLLMDETADMLAAPPEVAPDGFTDGVMARLREEAELSAVQAGAFSAVAAAGALVAASATAGASPADRAVDASTAVASPAAGALTDSASPAPPLNAGLRILWGLSGMVMGVALLLAFNPEWGAAVWMHEAFAAMHVRMESAVAWFTQAEVTAAFINSGLGLAALVFAGIIAALLYGLHRGERRSPGTPA